MICPKCQKDIDNQDEYCKFCGTNLKEKKPTPWYFKGWFIIVAAFIFLGPFALPLLWGSPDFSKKAKTILAIIIIIYTFILLIIPNLYLRKIYSDILKGL